MRLWSLKRAKFNLTLLARLKAQKYTFSAQISRILDFSAGEPKKSLTFTMRSYDPKHTPPMISSHSHYFRAALNAPKRANMKIIKIKNPRDFA